jgi:isocitrate dehydrogenase
LPEGKGSVSHSAVVKLLERITQAGVQFVKTEGLYDFDGKPSFAKG